MEEDEEIQEESEGEMEGIYSIIFKNFSVDLFNF